MSAAQQVINTAELLEMILLDVDMKSLLLSQRTCKGFQHTITGSDKLQRKLWFKPHRARTATLGHGGEESTSFTINPLFYQYNPYERDVWRQGLALRARVSEYSVEATRWFAPPPSHAVVECTREILNGGSGSWQRMVLLEGKEEPVDILWYCYRDATGARVVLRKELTMTGSFTFEQFVADIRAEDEKSGFHAD